MSMSSKPFAEIEEQIKILQKRALTITDIDDVRAKLLHHDYYTIINGYKYPFLSQDGTIIKLEGSGSDGGGRTAAAKQLSECGLAIKVSQDGYVQIFKNREPILEIMT